jgi:hypothetical protein
VVGVNLGAELGEELAETLKETLALALVDKGDVVYNEDILKALLCVDGEPAVSVGIHLCLVATATTAETQKNALLLNLGVALLELGLNVTALLLGEAGKVNVGDHCSVGWGVGI